MIIKSKITKKKYHQKFLKKFFKKNQKLSLRMTRILNKTNLAYTLASKEEIYDHVNFILKNLFSNKYWISGSTKKKKWDWGWNFNLKKIPILNIKKIKFGSPTHDSYSTIIWKVDN